MDKLKRYEVPSFTTDAIEVMQDIYIADEVDAILPRWVPVSERLPRDGLSVLVHGGIAYRVDDVWYTKMERNLDGGYATIQWNVTHWQPLPPPADSQDNDLLTIAYTEGGADARDEIKRLEAEIALRGERLEYLFMRYAYQRKPMPYISGWFKDGKYIGGE